MKKFLGLLIILFSILLFGCAGETSSETASQGEINSTINSQQPGGADFNLPAELPVINITTESGSKDFATTPVDGYVSSQIATWTPGYVMPPEPYYEKCTVSLTDGNNTVLLNDVPARVKVRGNWTTSYDKKPFRISFDEAQSMLDLNEGNSFKNWVLLAEFKDASLLRNKFALDISNALLKKEGLYSSDAELVNVYINNSYWGVYLLAEYQQINKGRVDITSAPNDYSGTDIGYFFEYDGYFKNEEPLQQFHIGYHNNAGLKPFSIPETKTKVNCLPKNTPAEKDDIGFTIKNKINSAEQRDFIENYVSGVYDIMYEAAYNNQAYIFNEDYSAIVPDNNISPQEAVEKVVNINSLVDAYIISELACDADLYWSSFYMSVDFGPEADHRLTFQAPWDFDSALGNKARCENGNGFYAASTLTDVNNTYTSINPWLAVLMYEDWYQNIIKAKWTELYSSGAFDSSLSLVSAITSTYSKDFNRNNQRWGICTQNFDVANELCKAAKKCVAQEKASDYLISWIKSRIEFMNKYWNLQ